MTARLAIALLGCAALLWHTAEAAPPARAPRSALEFAPASPTALAALEVEIGDLTVGTPKRLDVTDGALFVSSPGSDVRTTLALPDTSSGPSDAARTATLFSVRLIVVAGGRLYTGGRGQCGRWADGVARCAASCDGGTFAVRRNGAATLELMIGPVPGGAAGGGAGLLLSGCDVDDAGTVRLVAKSGRTLAVAAFARD